MNTLLKRRMLVLSDNQAVARMIELLAGDAVEVTKEILPLQSPPLAGLDGERLDLIVVALSSPAGEPVVALAQAHATQCIGCVPFLIISDKPFESDPHTRISYLNFPFDVDVLGNRIHAILGAGPNDGSSQPG